jgi:hypothetical protein
MCSVLCARFPSAFLFFAVFLVIPSAPQLAQAQSSLPQHKAPPPPATDQEQFLSYWTTEPGWTTELQLRNNLESRDLTVVPSVRSAAGVETALPAVTIKPGDVVSLDLYSTLTTAAPQLTGSWGSLVLRYHTVAHRALYAAAMVRADGRPITFHIDAYGRGSKYEVGSREGIWWLPWELVTDYLILTNSGEQVLQPTLTLYDSSGKTWQQALSLSARQSQRLSIRSLLQQAGLHGSYGGIKIDIAKGARFLDSTHLLFEDSGAFSAIMKMFRHDPRTTLSSRSFGGVKEWTTRAPMLALSDPDPALRLPAGTTLQPKVFIRNTTGKSFIAHIRFDWRSETASGKSAPLDLAFRPNETQVVDVTGLQAQKLLPANAHWAAVILSAAVQPDELLAVAASYDQTGRYGTQTPFSDQLASHWEGGKWEVDGTHNSLITIANGSDKIARAQLTILYNQGSGQYQLEQTLAPDEQMALDFGKLIHDRVPDKNGHTLPPGLTEGTYRLLDLNENPVGSLYEGKEIVDKTYGHASYTCMICCGPDSPWMMYDPLSVLIGGSGNQSVQAVNSCSERPVDVTGDFPTWWTDNSSIATASASQINGIAVGSTNHNALSINMYWGPKEDSGGSDCPLSQEQLFAATNVTPVITSVSPSRGLIGATTSSITITGKGLLGGHINTPAAIQVQNITTATDTQIVFDAVISGTATPGNNVGAIYVTVSGLNSNKKDFYVQVPTSLSVLSSQVISMSGYCSNPANTYGILLAIHYQVSDQAGTGISSTDMEPQEEVTNLVVNGFTNPDPVPNWNDIGPDAYPATSKFTDANGQYWDAPLGICWPTAFTSFSVTQAVTVLVGGTRYPVSGNARTNNWTGSSSSPGTGNITNGNDVSQSH